MDWIETGTEQLAPFILGIEYLIDPQAIFFGGRLPDVIIRSMVNRLQRILPALRIDARVASPELLCATAGTDAASLGVATLPLYTSFAPVPKTMEKKMKNAKATSKTNPLKAF
jgi:predicted NBD/HSP70 family sugar kinase